MIKRWIKAKKVFYCCDCPERVKIYIEKGLIINFKGNYGCEKLRKELYGYPDIPDDCPLEDWRGEK